MAAPLLWRPGSGAHAGGPDRACWSVMGEAELEDARGPSVYKQDGGRSCFPEIIVMRTGAMKAH